MSQGHMCRFDSQGLYSSKGSKGALGQRLDLVVIQRQQREILQVLEGVGTNAVDLIGIQQPEGVHRHMEGGRKEEWINLSKFLYTLIHYTFQLGNYAQVQSFFQGYDSFDEWE